MGAGCVDVFTGDNSSSCIRVYVKFYVCLLCFHKEFLKLLFKFGRLPQAELTGLRLQGRVEAALSGVRASPYLSLQRRIRGDAIIWRWG